MLAAPKLLILRLYDPCQYVQFARVSQCTNCPWGSLIALLFAFLVVGFVKIPGKQNRDGSLFWVEVTGLGVLIFQP